MLIEFCPTPYTFIEMQGFIEVWDAPNRLDSGVYLWCIEYGDAYLVNYVGMTVSELGFKGRLKTEFKDLQAGRYTTGVDLEAFKAGRRIERPEATPAEIQQQRTELDPMYRIFLAPILRDQPIRKVEDYIVHTLMQRPATAQYISNKLPRRYKRPTIEIEIAPTAPLIGLTSPIPAGLE